MGKICVLLAAILLIAGCAAQPVLETVGDIADVPAISQMRRLEIALPKEATIPTLQSEEGGALYVCDDYTIVVQTLESGDMDRTLRSLTGFGKTELTVMETESNGIKHCNCVWSATGEGGDYVGRALVLDDGQYHYSVSVMAEFSKAGDLSAKWKELLDSVRLVDTD